MVPVWRQVVKVDFGTQREARRDDDSRRRSSAGWHWRRCRNATACRRLRRATSSIPTQVSVWKRQLLDAVPEVFAKGGARKTKLRRLKEIASGAIKLVESRRRRMQDLLRHRKMVVKRIVEKVEELNDGLADVKGPDRDGEEVAGVDGDRAWGGMTADQLLEEDGSEGNERRLTLEKLAALTAVVGSLSLVGLATNDVPSPMVIKALRSLIVRRPSRWPFRSTRDSTTTCQDADLGLLWVHASDRVLAGPRARRDRIDWGPMYMTSQRGGQGAVGGPERSRSEGAYGERRGWKFAPDPRTARNIERSLAQFGPLRPELCCVVYHIGSAGAAC